MTEREREREREREKRERGLLFWLCFSVLRSRTLYHARTERETERKEISA